MEIKLGQWTQDNVNYITPIGKYNRVRIKSFIVNTNAFSRDLVEAYESPQGEILTDISQNIEDSKKIVEQHYLKSVKACYEIIKQDGKKEKKETESLVVDSK